MVKTKYSTSNKREKSTEGAKLLFLEKKLSPIPSASECPRLYGKRKLITWGHDNMYPQWLNYLYYNNSMHGGIVNGKVHYTVSGGLKYTPATNDPQELANWKLMYDNGLSDFNLDEIATQMARDFEISNKYILRGFWSVDFSRVERLELIDFETARKIENSQELFVCEDFSDRNVGYKIYQPLNLKLKGSKPEVGKTRSREFYIGFEVKPKQYLDKNTNKFSKRNYPVPTYSGAIRSICTGIEIDEWQNSEIVNNFSLGTVLNLNNGIPKNKKDRDDLKKEIRNSATGSTNSGGIWVNFSNGKDREATIVTLNGNNLAGRYSEVDKGTQKNILRAHSCVVPILFGVKEEGSLGNQTELLIGYSIMNKNYFQNRRRDIISTLQYIALKCNGLPGKIEFNEPSLDLPEDKPKEPTVMIQNGKFKDESEEKQSIEERMIKQLKFSGVERSKKRILYSMPMNESDDVIERFRKQEFVDIPEQHQQVLNLIGEGNDFNNIKKALNINASELAKIYSKLIDSGFVKDDGGLTKSGARQVAISDISKMEILYSYEKRAGVDGPPIIPGSRELCRSLIELDRLYTREEINRISAVEGYDVFSYAGGWWHDPKTDTTKPKCRHDWFQNVVFKD